MRQPAFWSMALTDIVDPDYTHVAVDVLPAHATDDPAAWARSLLSPAALPRWIAAVINLVTLSQRGSAAVSAVRVRRVFGDEALVGIDTRRIDVRLGVGVDEQHALVRVVTAIRFKGTAARFWSPSVRAALPFVVRGMIARTRRELSGVTR